MENRVRNSDRLRAHRALDVVQFKGGCFNIHVGDKLLAHTHKWLFLVKSFNYVFDLCL